MSEVKGRPWIATVDMQDEKGNPLSREQRPSFQALAFGRTVRAEGYYIRKDKTKFPVLAVWTPVIDEGKVIAAVSVLRDISREKEIEQLKTKFLSMAAHQLRTPLGAMRWNIEMLLGDMKETLSDGVREKLSRIYDDNQRMLMWVNDLLDISRIEQGRFSDNPVETDVEKVVQTIITEQAHEARKRSVTVTINPAANVPHMTIDAKRLHDVMQNLVTNAIKYNVPGGRVTIGIVPTDDSLKISVEDTGIGIPKDDIPHVVEKFFRAKNVEQTTIEGTGLGLYVVQSFVEGWGGNMDLQSTEGRGTTVTITLPLKVTHHPIQ